MSKFGRKVKLNKKKLFSAAIIAACGITGLGYSMTIKAPDKTIVAADKDKFITSAVNDREITNDTYDYNTISDHKIIKTTSELTESDDIKSLGNNVYIVPNDYEDNGIMETFNDDVVTVSGSISDSDVQKAYDNKGSALKKYLDGENTTGNDIYVAVIDSGISGSGTNIRIKDGVNFSATGGDDWSDDNGHGNVMAGIIEGMTSDNVNLVPIKVIDSSGRGTIASLYKGIE